MIRLAFAPSGFSSFVKFFFAHDPDLSKMGLARFWSGKSLLVCLPTEDLHLPCWQKVPALGTFWSKSVEQDLDTILLSLHQKNSALVLQKRPCSLPPYDHKRP